MPKLGKYTRPVVKVDGAGGVLDVAIPPEQVRGLWEKPGATVVGIVTLESISYTGHADGEEKAPIVRVRIQSFEAATSNEEAMAILEAGRAMYRRRTWDGTFDELEEGGLRDPEHVLQLAFSAYPSEQEFQDHQEAARVLRKEQREAEEKAREHEIANA